MAYNNQDKCEKCAKSIPQLPEDIYSFDELICDECNETDEYAAAVNNLIEGVDPDAEVNSEFIDCALADGLTPEQAKESWFSI